MKSGIGQCTMFLNLMHYLLENSYDEVGYIGVRSPGDFVDGKGGRYYPVGTEVIPYHGVTNITYREAGYEWDTQTRIDY